MLREASGCCTQSKVEGALPPSKLGLTCQLAWPALQQLCQPAACGLAPTLLCLLQAPSVQLSRDSTRGAHIQRKPGHC